MNLILSESVSPELGYALVFITIFVCLWTIGAYYASSSLQEPIMMKTIGGYTVIDSESWKVFLIPVVICLFTTMLCFRVRLHKLSEVREK